MPVLPLDPQPLPAPPGRLLRIEYRGFQNVAAHREFRLRAGLPDQSAEFRLRIALDAFSASGVRLQDGPDVCYQKLLAVITAGETSTDVITIDEADLASYREAHTRAPKQRSWAPSTAPKTAGVPRPPRRTPSPHLPVGPLTKDPEPAFGEGQRVSHTVFGVGVTTSSNAGHTVVHFDQDGSRRFVTAMLVLDVLSEPHTWETGPRGKNRPCGTLSPPADGL